MQTAVIKINSHCILSSPNIKDIEPMPIIIATL